MTTPPEPTPTWIQSSLARVEVWRARLERTLLWQVWERMLEVQFIDRSVALAGKAFVSFFPLVIVVAAFLGPDGRHAIVSTMEHRFGLSGEALVSTRAAFASASDIRHATGMLGLITTIFFASSFTSALQRIYLAAWRRPRGAALRKYALGISWTAMVIVYAAIFGFVRLWSSGEVAVVAYTVLATVGSTGLWWFTAWLMLMGQVRPRVLYSSGLITGLTVSGYALSAAVWMPRTLQSNQNQFGVFGVALALVTWFSGAAVCVLVGACAAPVFAEDRGPIGRVIRGSKETLLVPGAPDSLPAPPKFGLLGRLPKKGVSGSYSRPGGIISESDVAVDGRSQQGMGSTADPTGVDEHVEDGLA